MRSPVSRRRSLALLALLVAVLLAVLVSACRPPEPAAGNGPTPADRGAVAGDAVDGLRLRLELSSTAVGPAPATVHVLDGSQGLGGASVEVQGDMSHAGMQPVIVTAVESEPGVYRADDFAFTMAGDWFVTVTVTTADGRQATEETFVSVGSR